MRGDILAGAGSVKKVVFCIMEDLPEGVVTFLFTDVEGSTRLWEEAPDSMMEALRQHDEAIDGAASAHTGVPVRPRGEGDSRFIVFASAADAVAGAAEMQRRLDAVDWATPQPLRVRASVHTGPADLRLGDYYGSAVNRAARLRAIAHGGQTVLSGATYELLGHDLPPGVSLRDMGRHGLKDLTEPEQVYQVDIEGLDDRFPPLASLNAVPNNLPQQVTEFVGRESELADIGNLLDEARLVTVLAPGGVGKTRLALQVAAEATAEYADGVFFIGLADIGSSDEIVLDVAESIGLGFSSVEDVQTQLLTYLANKRQLLVFDNFEHLLDGAGIISKILQGAPGITVLATSRSKLNLSGETVFTLAGLETTLVTLDQAEQASGARLFIDAARRANSGFAVQTDDLEPLSEILRLTGGVPLGILLAAAWTDTLSVADIAAEIAKSLDFLESDLGDVPDRQRSVRAVFDYSWSLLGTDEQTVFAALSIFRGGFTREAAEAVAGASLRDLATLGGRSLVTPSPETGRFRVHELLRQYAEEELRRDPEVADELVEAHAAFYGTLVEEAWALFEHGEQRQTVSIIEGDLDNVRLAWRHYLATNNAAGARRFIGGLWVVYEIRGWYPPALELFGEALDAFDEHANDEATVTTRALATAVQSWFLPLVGQAEAGAASSERAIEILRSADDGDALLVAFNTRFIALVYLRMFEAIIMECEEAIALGNAMDRPFWAGVHLGWKAAALIISGDVAMGKRFLDEEFEMLSQHGDRFFLSFNFGHQARIATREGRLEDAVDLFSRSVEMTRELGHTRGMQFGLHSLGEAHVAVGSLEAAEMAFTESLAAAEQMRMLREMLGMIAKIATVRALTGRQVDAVELNATVVADPGSAQTLLTAAETIGEGATAALATLEAEMDPDEYAAAHARGTSTAYDVAAKGLIDGLTQT